MAKIFINLIFVMLFLILIDYAAAQSEIISIGALRNIAVPIHIIELILAFFICYMSLKFFRITKPIGLFFYVYTALGFFIVNTLLYLFMYLSLGTRFEMKLVNVYIGSRVALIGMLIWFVIFFYQWNKVMKGR